jgi:hypothetical protein
MIDENPNPFNIIKHRGEPNKAEFEGVTVIRQPSLDADEWGLIPCAPYDNHFIFAVPESRIRPGMWEHFCTCGSHAVIAIPENMFVCYFYHSRLHEEGHGYHQTTVINKNDFENVAGQTIELPKGKKWLI